MHNHTLYPARWTVADEPGPFPLVGVLLLAIVLKHLLPQHYGFCTIGRDFLSDVPLGRILLTDLADLEENLRRAIDNGCQAFVVDEPGIRRLLDVYRHVHDSAHQRSLDKRVILLVTRRNRAKVLDLIVAHKTLRDIPHMLIVVYDEVDQRVTGCYTISAQYHGGNAFPSVSLRQLAPIEWIDGGRDTLFPDKSKDLDGYVLRMATMNYLPFARWLRVEPDHGNAYDAVTGERSIWLDGTELRLMVSFCQRRNCTLLVTPEDEDGWGDVYPNGTGRGVLGSVSERRTDIALAAIYLWYKPYNFTAYTATISRSGVTVLVPKPHMQPFWRTPFLSFSWPLWTAVMVTFVVGSVVAWVAGQVRYRLLGIVSGRAPVSPSEKLPASEVLLTMVGFFVAQSSPVRYDLWSCVFLFASLLLAGFMVSNLYSGGLASVMTVPQYEKSIDTVRDFAASGMQWFGPTTYCLEEIVSATEPHLKQIQTTYRVCSDVDDARRYARAGRSGFIIEHAQHGNFAPSDFLDRKSSRKFQTLRDDIYFGHCVALMTKTNPLRQSLNEYILLVQQSGLMYRWGTSVAISHLPTDVFRNIEQARLHRRGDGRAVTLKIDHFLGAFFILGYGLLCAAGVFVGELLQPTIVRRMRPSATRG